jgi:hypothetical protein
MRAVMAVYRFLASLKLAVISLLSLAGSLAYATIYVEKNYGTIAVNEWVYESAWFSILLAFLATNILCAALIRFPWKKRQTGFVVTHAGLLVLIFGAWWGFQFSDEGQAGAVEGGRVDKLIRTKHPILRIQELDERTGQATVERELPFNGGALDWPKGKYEVVSRPKDPFKVAVTGFHPAGRRVGVEHVASEHGAPMLKLRPRAKPPRASEMIDAFPSESSRWFSFADATQGYRITRRAGAAKFAFLYVDSPELVEDFLNPAKDLGALGVARIHYADSSGKPRIHDVPLDNAEPGKPIALPGSDFTASFLDVLEGGGEDIDIVRFKVRRGAEPAVEHLGVSGRPMAPAVMPRREEPTPEALVKITYDRAPLLGGKGMSGTFGLVEVLGDPQGHLYYRVFGRDETPVAPELANQPRPGVLRKGPAPLKLGETVVAFGGNPNMPMTLEFSAEEYLVSGEEKDIYDRQPMPDGKQGDGLAAAKVELTVDGVTKDVWVQRPAGLEMPPFTPVRFRGKDFKVAFDSEREPLGFAMTLKDFEVTYDPGTSKAASYKSEVLLTDEKAGLKDQPISITMNHPLTHRKLTFYQSSFHESQDRATRGDFVSVFQVGHDAGRPLKYAGSLLLVIGVFLQFTMRAGVFTGAAKDDAKAAERARKLLRKKGEKVAPVAERKNKAKKSKSYDDAIL